MTELVLDANIFGHAVNPGNEFFESALAVVSGFLESSDRLALDDTGKISPDQATSNLYREYLATVSPTSLSAIVLTTLLLDQRVVFYPRPVKAIWTQCQALVPRNNNDAIVLGIAVSTSDRYLITNDYRDFPTKVRKSILKKFNVVVNDSDEHSAAA